MTDSTLEKVDVLVVGGGGAGNNAGGGAGGGGGVIYDPNSTLSSTTVTVTVGDGGSAGDGGNSNFDGLVASGGKFSSTWASGSSGYGTSRTGVALSTSNAGGAYDGTGLNAGGGGGGAGGGGGDYDQEEAMCVQVLAGMEVLEFNQHQWNRSVLRRRRQWSNQMGLE